MTTLKINGKLHELSVDERMPLLWAIRDFAGLKGTKYGCGQGFCGSCTVHVDGAAVKSCVVPVRAVRDKDITTIEGLSSEGRAHPLQRAWIEEQVPQCGYCQPGQIMAAAAFLGKNPRPTETQIKESITNICRCGTYLRIHAAIRRAAAEMSGDES